MPRFCQPLVANMLLILALWPQFVLASSQVPVVMALANAPTTLDSRFSTGASSSRIAQLLSLPLITLADDFTPKPAAAKSFEWLDDKTLKFTLGHWQFTDGTLLTAHEVHAFYQSLQAPKTRSPYMGQLADMHQIKVLDAKNIVFTFKTGGPFIWPLFAHPLMRPGKALQGGGPALQPIGLGPYKVAKGSRLDDLTLTLSEHWQGPAPASAVLKFKTVKDPLVRLLKVQRGEAHLLQNDMPAAFLGYAKNSGGLKVQVAPSTNYTYLGFNFADKTTGNQAVRKAIAYALNREEIVNTLLFGMAQPAQSILPATHPGYWPAPLRGHNPHKARQILDEAGFVPDENGVRLTLRFSTTSNPSTLLLVQAIAHQLKQVGIDLKMNVSEWGTFYGNILKGNFQMYLLTWVGVFDADIYQNIFHSSKAPPHGANRGRFVNLEMDKNLEKLLESSKNIYATTAQIQQIQHQMLPYVPLWQRDSIALMHPSVHGFTMALDGSYNGLLTTFVKE